MQPRRSRAARAAVPSPPIDLAVFRQMADVSNEGMYLLDRTGRFLYVNAQALAQMGGYTRAEILGLTVSDICPDVPPEVFDGNVAALADGPLPIVEAWTRRKDGTMFLAAVSMARLDYGDDQYAFGVARDVTERKAAEAMRKDLAAQILQTIEDERGRVARELHDDVGQALATIGVLLDALGTSSETIRAAVQPILVATRTTVARVTESLARIVREYHPAELLGLGLEDTLVAHAHHVAERHGLELHLETVPVEGLLTPEAELHVYRIVQEALANTVRHARATSVWVSLTRGSGRLVVRIADDGAGFDAEQPAGNGVGLATMRERAMLLQGELAIESAPGRGSTVRLALPIGAAPSPLPPLPDAGPDGTIRVAEAAIRRSAEHADTGTLPPVLDLAVFRQMADMSSEAFFLADHDGRFVYVNARAATLSGSTVAELLGKSVPEINPDYTPERWREWATAAARTVVPPFETKHRQRDGTIIPVEVSAAHIEARGRSYFFAVVRDLQDLKEAEAAERGFTRRLLHTLEAERRRVARELHDEVGQAIATVGVLLHTLGGGTDTLPSDLGPEVAATHRTIGQITESVARIVRDYHPADLLGLGLEDALRTHARSFAHRHGLALRLVTTPVEGYLSDEQALHVYRIVQEALANVARHAGARRVGVRLGRHGGRVVASVGDDGVGFDPAGVRTGRLGLVAMRERAALMDATLEVRSRPGHGTRVRVAIPEQTPHVA